MLWLDRFDPSLADATSLPSQRAVRWFVRTVCAIARVLRVEVQGMGHLPRGRCLLVANHAFGWDVAFPMAAIVRDTGRRVWVLGEHRWWRVPWLRVLAASVGVADGRRDVAERLLRAGDIVIVLPGGLREAVKPRELRYHLLWGRRYGFVEVAVRAKAPIVPLACVGADELFDFVGDAYARGRRWLRVEGIPVPLPARILPIPHVVPLRYILGEPIVVEGVALDDPRALRRLRREVEGALHELLEQELARRAGVPYP
jgi:1-acyl-sn-glycerol-3-phosphate acyltransferase